MNEIIEKWKQYEAETYEARMIMANSISSAQQGMAWKIDFHDFMVWLVAMQENKPTP